MTTKKFHLSLPQQDKICALSFLNKESKIIKDLKESKNHIEIEFDIESDSEIEMNLVSEETTDLMLDILKYKLLKDYIKEQYEEIYSEEVDNIYTHSLEIFSKKEKFIKSAIYKKIGSYISNNDYLNIEGFVNFRIKELANYISKIGDIAVEEYIIKKDQDEFINVLKYFIEVQDEKIDLIKIHILKDNSFMLYDNYGKEIESIDNEDIINMIIKENLNNEDFLISTLLTLCPGKIEILDTYKSESSKEIIKTIKSLFGDKVKMVYQN